MPNFSRLTRSSKLSSACSKPKKSLQQAVRTSSWRKWLLPCFGHIRRRVLENGVDFTSAVITVPANSRGLARYRTKVCAGIGEIEPLALLNEPTAAAMAYSRRQVADEQTVLVFDFGGGTLDVTLLDTREGMFFEQASRGVPRLGGIDFDNAIFQDLVQHVANAGSWTTAEKNRVRVEVERAKINLSTQDEYTILIEGLIPSGFRLTRPRFNELTRPFVERSGPAIERVLSDMRMGSGDVDTLLLVGGMSKVPAVQQFVSELVGKEPATGVDPMTAIGEGAAIAAAILTGETDRQRFCGIHRAFSWHSCGGCGGSRPEVLTHHSQESETPGAAD